MHFTLGQLQVFEAVAHHLSYTRAAEELHLTQPAVSMQVRQLEDYVGMPLFEQMENILDEITSKQIQATRMEGSQLAGQLGEIRFSNLVALLVQRRIHRFRI